MEAISEIPKIRDVRKVIDRIIGYIPSDTEANKSLIWHLEKIKKDAAYRAPELEWMVWDKLCGRLDYVLGPLYETPEGPPEWALRVGRTIRAEDESATEDLVSEFTGLYGGRDRS